MAEIFAKVEKGDAHVIAEANTGYTIHTVTSGRVFGLENLILTNRSDICEVNIYDGASGGPQVFGASGKPLLRLIVGETSSAFYGAELLKGVNFVSSVIAFAAVSGAFIRIGGSEF